MLNLLDPSSGLKNVEPVQLFDASLVRKRTGWPIRGESRFANCASIHPMQRKKVDTILTYLNKDPNIKKVIVFGSSVRADCHVGSDVDMYIEMEKEKKLPEFGCVDFLYDLWTNYTVDERMLREITEKGVTVYERGRNVVQ